MADLRNSTKTMTTQIPVEMQTDEYRIRQALDAMEAATNHEALGRAWRRAQPLRDHLDAKHQAGDGQAWQNLKRLHRALYSRQFLIGQADAESS